MTFFSHIIDSQIFQKIYAHQNFNGIINMMHYVLVLFPFLILIILASNKNMEKTNHS